MSRQPNGISIIFLLVLLTCLGCAGGSRLAIEEHGNEKNKELRMLTASGEFWAIPSGTLQETRLLEKKRNGEVISQNAMEALLREAHAKPVIRTHTFLKDENSPRLIGSKFMRHPAPDQTDFTWSMKPVVSKGHPLRWEVKFSAKGQDKSVDSARETSELETDSGNYRIVGPIRYDRDRLYGFITLRHMTLTKELFPEMKTATGGATRSAQAREDNRNTSATARTPAIKLMGELIAVPSNSPVSKLLPLLLRDAGTLGLDTMNALFTYPGTRIIMRPRMVLGSGGSGSFKVMREQNDPYIDQKCYATLQPNGQVSLHTSWIIDMQGGCELLDRKQVIQPDTGRYSFVGSCPQGKEDVYAFIAAGVVH